MDFKLETIERHDDKRGKLIILLKKKDLPKKERTFGEVFYITFSKKGISRANHYHNNWREWFIVVSGKIQVNLEDLKSKRQVSFTLDSKSKDLKRLEVGPLIAHSFKSLSKDAVLLNYSNREWRKKNVINYQVNTNGKKTKSGKKK